MYIPRFVWKYDHFASGCHSDLLCGLARLSERFIKLPYTQKSKSPFFVGFNRVEFRIHQSRVWYVGTNKLPLYQTNVFLQILMKYIVFLGRDKREQRYYLRFSFFNSQFIIPDGLSCDLLSFFAFHVHDFEWFVRYEVWFRARIY